MTKYFVRELVEEEEKEIKAYIYGKDEEIAGIECV